MSNWKYFSLPSVVSIDEEILRQSTGSGCDNFVCLKCVNYKGGLVCLRGIFIAFEGANTANCQCFKQGKKCPHCGLMV